jgi:hypothetical protein
VRDHPGVSVVAPAGSSVASNADDRLAEVGRLCSACVSDTGVDGGGVSVLSKDGTSVTLVATDEVSAVVAELQFTLGEGPCFEAAAQGTAVLVADLADPRTGAAARWPVFIAEARRVGVNAVFTFPIHVGEVTLGTLDLYRETPGRLDERQVESGFTTVSAMGDRLLELESPVSSGRRTYPMIVHQAAGMVMVQLGCGIDEALVRLRATAYADGLSVAELAAAVVGGRRRIAKEEQHD